MALASVLRRKVRLVYPPINGTADLAHTALHDVFDPFGHKIEQDEVVIMWTVFGNKHLHSGIWTPDHFVPLLPKSRSKLNAKLYVPDNIPTQITKMKEFSTETCVMTPGFQTMMILRQSLLCQKQLVANRSVNFWTWKRLSKLY